MRSMVSYEDQPDLSTTTTNLIKNLIIITSPHMLYHELFRSNQIEFGSSKSNNLHLDMNFNVRSEKRQTSIKFV